MTCFRPNVLHDYVSYDVSKIILKYGEVNVACSGRILLNANPPTKATMLEMFFRRVSKV